MGPTLQVVELERKPAVGHRVTRSEKSVFPRASIPRPSAGQAFGIRGLSSGGVEGARRGAERLLTEGKVLGKRRILRFGNYRDSSPCLPNWGRLSTSPSLPTHRLPDRPSFTRAGVPSSLHALIIEPRSPDQPPATSVFLQPYLLKGTLFQRPPADSLPIETIFHLSECSLV